MNWNIQDLGSTSLTFIILLLSLTPFPPSALPSRSTGRESPFSKSIISLVFAVRGEGELHSSTPPRLMKNEKWGWFMSSPAGDLKESQDFNWGSNMDDLASSECFHCDEDGWSTFSPTGYGLNDTFLNVTGRDWEWPSLLVMGVTSTLLGLVILLTIVGKSGNILSWGRPGDNSPLNPRERSKLKLISGALLDFCIKTGLFIKWGGRMADEITILSFPFQLPLGVVKVEMKKKVCFPTITFIRFNGGQRGMLEKVLKTEKRETKMGWFLPFE